MLFHTHLLLGVTFFLLIREAFPTFSSITSLLFVLLGSILPDIDEKHSKINQWSGIFGKVIAFFSTHRGFYHSFLFIFVVGVLMNYFLNFNYALALFVGFTAHMVGDGITPMGVRLFYPISKFTIRGPIRAGGKIEHVIAILLLVFIVTNLV